MTTEYNHEMDGPDAVAHWRQRHDLVKARSNRQFEELEAVRWELNQAKDEVLALQRERIRLHEQRDSDKARIAHLEHEIDCLITGEEEE